MVVMAANCYAAYTSSHSQNESGKCVAKRFHFYSSKGYEDVHSHFLNCPGETTNRSLLLKLLNNSAWQADQAVNHDLLA